MNDAQALDEAERQAALLAVLAAPGGTALATVEQDRFADLRIQERGERLAKGVAAYRAQATATAARALASVFPTVRQMIGTGDFERLADEFREAQPPVRGDLGEWGADLPTFIEQHVGLAAWPWLGDSGRLDLAVHRNERAADAMLDTASLYLLQTTDPALVRLELMPGSALLCSKWPIATILATHRTARPESEVDQAFRAVAEAVAGRRGETVLVVRRGWRAAVRGVDEAEAGWLRSLHDGVSLATALRSAGVDFDFSAWLVRAVRECSISGVVLLGQP